MHTYFSRLKNFPNSRKKLGFSLIEVLIVAAVFIILLVVAAQQFGPQMAKGRDARRKSDLETIKKAFEDYASDRNQYPPFGTLDSCGDSAGTALEAYLAVIPCDPLDETPYIYVPYPDYANTSGGYRVYAKLEVLTDPTITTLGCSAEVGCGLTVETIPEQPERYNYGVSEGVPVGVSEGDPLPTDVPTQGICCPPNTDSCNMTALVSGSCPGNPPSAPFPNLSACIQYSVCTQ